MGTCLECLDLLKIISTIKISKKNPDKTKQKQKKDTETKLREHLRLCSFVKRQAFWPLTKRVMYVSGPSASSPPSDELPELVLHDSGLPLVYLRSKLPNKLKRREPVIRPGTYVAVRGTKRVPYHVWKIKKIRNNAIEFQWVQRRQGGVYEVEEAIDIQYTNQLPPFLHWGFAFRRNGMMFFHDIQLIGYHDMAWPENNFSQDNP